MRRPGPIQIRPTPKAKEAADLLRKQGKLNRSINDFLETLAEESPAVLKIDIDQLTTKNEVLQERADALLSEIKANNKEISQAQSRLNSYIHKDEEIVVGQAELLKGYVNALKQDTLRGAACYKNWLDCWPEVVRKAGFNNPDMAIIFCKAQKVKP